MLHLDLFAEDGTDMFMAQRVAIGYVREQIKFYMQVDEPEKVRLLLPLMCYYRQVVGTEQKFVEVWLQLVEYAKEKGWTL